MQVLLGRARIKYHLRLMPAELSAVLILMIAIRVYCFMFFKYCIEK